MGRLLPTYDSTLSFSSRLYRKHVGKVNGTIDGVGGVSREHKKSLEIIGVIE